MGQIDQIFNNERNTAIAGDWRVLRRFMKNEEVQANSRKSEWQRVKLIHLRDSMPNGFTP